MLEKFGILLIATGHPYYGRNAYNLACTIKAVEEIPIAIIHQGGALSHLGADQTAIFDQIIPLPATISEGFGTKLHLADLSPFEETLYLDVDMLWLPYKKPSQLRAEFGDIDFTGITEGYYDLALDDKQHASGRYFFWAEPEEIKKVYGFTEGKLYQWRSEVMYFTKTDRVQSFFESAQHIHANPRLASRKTFGSQIPDELGLNIASVLHDMHPHKYQWTPAYWHKLHRDQIPPLAEVANEWYLMSFGGHFINPTAAKIYDQVVKLAMNKLGRQHVFSITSKKSFLPERAKM